MTWFFLTIFYKTQVELDLRIGLNHNMLILSDLPQLYAKILVTKKNPDHSARFEKAGIGRQIPYLGHCCSDDSVRLVIATRIFSLLLMKREEHDKFLSSNVFWKPGKVWWENSIKSQDADLVKPTGFSIICLFFPEPITFFVRRREPSLHQLQQMALLWIS